MSEIGDVWDAIRTNVQEEKRARVAAAPARLTEAGLRFVVFDGDGQHIRVEDVWDFWPSTGLFMRRGSRRRMHGIEKLIHIIKGKPE